MKIANSIDDFIAKYLMENNEIADDISSLISSEEIISAEDPRFVRIVKHLCRAIALNPDWLRMVFMEAEIERERRAEEKSKQAFDENKKAKYEAVQAKEASDKIAEAERKEKEFWKAQFEALQQKVQG